MNNMFVSEINIYPIKSLGGIAVEQSIVEQKGLQFDRCWLLVNEKNEFLTQRDFPKMAVLKISIGDKELRVFDGEDCLEIPFAPNGEESASAKIWSSRVRALVYDERVNDWFGNALQIDCKLVVMPEEAKRRVNYFYAVHKDDRVSFADGYPFLLTGESSLADLNARLENAVSMNRFRPNFVVSGGDAFDEDDWKKIRIGGTVFHVVKSCGRCVITTIDQETGISDGKEPLKTLATYRTPKRSTKKKILFGRYLIAETVGATVRVGDEIEVLERKN